MPSDEEPVEQFAEIADDYPELGSTLMYAGSDLWQEATQATYVIMRRAFMDAADSTIGRKLRSAPRSIGANAIVWRGFAYDDAGRLVEVNEGNYRQTFVYDAEGRLKSAQDSRGGQVLRGVSHFYDAFGSRVRTERTLNDTIPPTETTTRYVYDGLGMDVVADLVDLDSNGTVDFTRTYWDDPTIDKRLGC